MISSRKLLSKINSFKEGIEPTILGIVTCGLEIISINFIFCRIGEDPKTSKVGLISSGEILKLVTKSINLSRFKILSSNTAKRSSFTRPREYPKRVKRASASSCLNKILYSAREVNIR